jgi:selenium metabolism protein YedF
MKTVDAKGQKCPMPLILTKRALMEMEPDETLEIIIDNETSVQNVSRFLAEHQMNISTENQGGVYRLTVTKTGVITEQSRAEDYCEIPLPDPKDYVVVFGKNIQGEGSDEFGARLIQLFINTLPDIDHKPRIMVFLNTCIFLTLRDSPVLGPLAALEKAGIRILVCGTCLDYFQKKEELAIGVVSNMYEIMDHLSKASKVLYP